MKAGPGWYVVPLLARAQPSEQDGVLPQIRAFYWYLAVTPLSDSSWDGVVMLEMEAEDLRVVAPMLFTTRENAEAELRTLRKGMADAYLRAVGEYVETDVNDALDKTPELEVLEIEPWLLGEDLERVLQG